MGQAAAGVASSLSAEISPRSDPSSARMLYREFSFRWGVNLDTRTVRPFLQEAPVDCSRLQMDI